MTEKPNEPSTSKTDASSKPSTSKEESKPEEPETKSKMSETLKHESDSETQHTSCSEESMEELKPKIPGPLDNLILLALTIDELFAVVESKAQWISFCFYSINVN